MPDSYGICLTLVILRGAKTALATIMLAPIAIATITSKKTGVNSPPIRKDSPSGRSPVSLTL